jgi:surfactin synthase thioesterase subunit
MGTVKPVVALIPPSCCGAGYFRRLRRAMADTAVLRPVELPGHGRRYAEAALIRAEPALADVLGQLAELGGPVDAVYGESLGAYIGLAVAAAMDVPALIVASNSPPSVREPFDVEGLTGFAEAAAALAAVGGEIPPEVAADPALAGRAHRMILDDLRLASSFVEATRTLRIRGDIGVLAGAEDRASTHLDLWPDFTEGACTVTGMPGGHLLSATNPHGVAEAVLRAVRT